MVQDGKDPSRAVLAGVGNAQIDVSTDNKVFRQKGCRETEHTQYPTQMSRQFPSLEMDLKTQE